MSELENSEQHYTELQNKDVKEEGCMFLDKQKWSSTSCCVELRPNTTDLSSVPKPDLVDNAINTTEDPTIKTRGAETDDTKEAKKIQEVTGADGVMKDETTSLGIATNKTVKKLPGFANDVSRLETDQFDNGDVRNDTAFPAFDRNVAQLPSDSSANEIFLENNFCDIKEGMKGKSLSEGYDDVWCKSLELSNNLQHMLSVFMQTPRNLIAIKTDMRKGVIKFFQKLKRQTLGYISKTIHSVVKCANFGFNVVTFAVREFITWSDEPFIRIILNNDMLKQYFLVGESFRLATFGHYSRRIPQPVVLRLARDGYFCDPDGTIRCFKCYTELSENGAYGVHNRCRFSYIHENMSIRNNYGNLDLERILGVNHQNRDDLLTRGMRYFDDVVLHRTPFQEQRRRQLLPLLDTSNVISLDRERRRRGIYSGRTIDLQAYREPLAPTGSINIQSRVLTSLTVNPTNEMLERFETQGALLNTHTDLTLTCHTNSTPTAVESHDQISNGTHAAASVTNSFHLSEETHVKQLQEASYVERLGNSTGTVVIDFQSEHQHQQENIEIPAIESSHSSNALLASVSSEVQSEIQPKANDWEGSEPPTAVSFRGSHTKIDTGSVQPEQFQRPNIKNSLIPAPDIPNVSVNSEHGEDYQPENVEFALQISPGTKQTSPINLCANSVSVQGPHAGNSLQPTVTGSFKSIRKRHPSQPTFDKSDLEARRNVLPRKVIRTRHNSEPTVYSENKPCSTVAQAFYESIEDSFTPRSEQRKCSLACDQEKKPFRHLDHPDKSASAEVPNKASCVENLAHASLQIKETDVSEQSQGAMAAAQSITDADISGVISLDREQRQPEFYSEGAARAINEHKKRRRRKTEKRRKTF